MATVILIIIYIAYIGLGIPDSLLGASWPSIYRDFSVSESYASYISLMISIGTILSGFCAGQLIRKMGTALLSSVSTAMTAVALLGFMLSPSVGWMFLFTLPLGFGAGGIDTALNNYVAMHYKPAHMNFLHFFYGLGVTATPYIVSLTLKLAGGWRGSYFVITVIQMSVALLLFLSLPLWKKVGEKENEENTQAVPGIWQIYRIPGVIPSCLLFICSCSIEFVCGIWGATYLVEGVGLPPAEAAGKITLYYIGITASRLLSGIFAFRLSSRKILFLFTGIMGIGIILLFLPVPSIFSVAGLFLIGAGNGPVFPTLLQLTPGKFGRELSQSVMGAQLAGAYIGIAAAPFVFGLVAKVTGTWMFPVFLTALFLLFCGLLRTYNRGKNER